MKKFWRKAAFCVLVMMCFSGCSKKEKSDRPTLNINYSQDEDGNSYRILNGSKQYTFQVEEGKYYDVEVGITKEKGKIDIMMYRDEKDNSIYSGNDLDTSDFTVRADKTGDYTVLFTVEDFVGEVSCNLISSDGSSVKDKL